MASKWAWLFGGAAAAGGLLLLAREKRVFVPYPGPGYQPEDTGFSTDSLEEDKGGLLIVGMAVRAAGTTSLQVTRRSRAVSGASQPLEAHVKVHPMAGALNITGDWKAARDKLGGGGKWITPSGKKLEEYAKYAWWHGCTKTYVSGWSGGFFLLNGEPLTKDRVAGGRAGTSSGSGGGVGGGGASSGGGVPLIDPRKPGTYTVPLESGKVNMLQCRPYSNSATLNWVNTFPSAWKGKVTTGLLPGPPLLILKPGDYVEITPVYTLKLGKVERPWPDWVQEIMNVVDKIGASNVYYRVVRWVQNWINDEDPDSWLGRKLATRLDNLEWKRP